MRTLLPVLLLLLTAPETAQSATPVDTFFARLAALCGKAFEGRVTSSGEVSAILAGKRLVMHVRECSANNIRIPVHVGEDRSRTWVVTRTGSALSLRHDHRHQDGSEDTVTQYGGGSVSVGTAKRQEFPADQFSKAMFVRANNPQGVNNVWIMEVEPRRSFAYELRRPSGFVRFAFDLSKTVTAPPAPWGSR